MRMKVARAIFLALALICVVCSIRCMIRGNESGAMYMVIIAYLLVATNWLMSISEQLERAEMMLVAFLAGEIVLKVKEVEDTPNEEVQV